MRTQLCCDWVSDAQKLLVSGCSFKPLSLWSFPRCLWAAVPKYHQVAVNKQQRLTAHGSGGWKWETRCPQSRCTVTACFLAHPRQEGPGSSLGLFDKGIDPIPEAPPS